MAAVAALMRSKYRYNCLLAAAKELHMEPIIIEDLVKFGEDIGREAGRAEGKAEAIVAVLAARGLKVPAATRKRVLGCTEPEKLDGWLRRVAVVNSARELLPHASRPLR